MFGLAAADREVAAGDSAGDHEGAASMRSGMMRCRRRAALATPWMRMVQVPAPSMLRSHLVQQSGEIG